MTTDDTLEMENYNMALTEKQQKYLHYHPGKLINMNILHVKNDCFLIESK